MNREQFFEAIKDGFFKEQKADLEGFKQMVKGALPVFGTLETTITDLSDGKTITFIDRSEADMIYAPEGVDAEDVNTDMSSVIMELNVDTEGVIKTVSHGIQGLFTPSNKESVLLLASLVGKKIDFPT
ncbi:hypothetical protein IMZ31_24200 (plasmid) [Pontibacillus sp. ALD_SL1]|uniref:hypothetical protein n=1 Tax=Pontibacillus sp. ALD_SL1 TaxID=2777185 RepID=UPI001A96E645|nr:hypothetical protein [Pontibacillus sp. ALD_SL1]QST02555.1 hypothetical protein IMZ31_24200 [Pontibacillus sp. ALD_SL1]